MFDDKEEEVEDQYGILQPEVFRAFVEERSAAYEKKIAWLKHMVKLK